MGSISYHSNQSSYPIKTKNIIILIPIDAVCVTIDPVVSEKKIFEIMDDGRSDDGRQTDGRTPEHGYTISSPISLRLR